MSSDKDPVNATRGSLRLAPSAADVEIEKAKLPRQFVNFTFYHARPEWRLLSADGQAALSRRVYKDCRRISPVITDSFLFDYRTSYKCRFHDLAHRLRARPDPGDDFASQQDRDGQVHRAVAIVSLDDEALDVHR